MADKKTIVKKADQAPSLEQLRADLAAKRADLQGYERSHAAGELANPRVLNATRREIARLHTAIRAREIQGEKGSK